MYLTPYCGTLRWGEWRPSDGRLTLRYAKVTDTLSVEIDGARTYAAQKRQRVGDDNVSLRVNHMTGNAHDGVGFHDREGVEIRHTVPPQEDVEPGTAQG